MVRLGREIAYLAFRAICTLFIWRACTCT